MLSQIEILKIAKARKITPEKACKIVDMCEKYDLTPKGNVLRRSPEDIEKISRMLIDRKLIPNETRSAFAQRPKAVEQVIEICDNNNIKIEPHIFNKKPEELTDCIDWIRANYGENYVIAHTVMRDLDKLKVSMPLLKTLGLLRYSKHDPSIFDLSREAILERTGVLHYLCQPLHRIGRNTGIDRVNRAYTYSDASFDDFCYINGVHEIHRKNSLAYMEKLVKDFEERAGKKSVK